MTLAELLALSKKSPAAQAKAQAPKAQVAPTLADLVSASSGLARGATTEVWGSGSSPYRVKHHLDGVWSCSCPAWRNQSLPPDERTCKHIRGVQAGGGASKAQRVRPGFRCPDCEVEGASSMTVTHRSGCSLASRRTPKAQVPRSQAQRTHPLEAISVCMTGFRDADMEAAIVAAGGSVASGVSKTLGILVAKDPHSTSGKAQKARELGVLVLSIAQMNAKLAGKAQVQTKAQAKSQVKAQTKAQRRSSANPLGAGVLLAEKWTSATDPTGWWMSEKLDGVRAIWDGTAFYSRNGNRFEAPRSFTDRLPTDTRLDGELYAGPGLFNQTISIVRSGTPDPKRWEDIRYMVFDVPDSSAPFEERIGEVEQIVRQACTDGRRSFCPIVAVEQTKCRSAAHLGTFHAAAVAEGIEGTMLRAAGSRYEPRRSQTLLKVKDFHDAEARIVGYAPGEGRHKGRLGAYECEDLTTGVAFRVGTGLSDRDRDQPLKKGTVITYRYQELTPAGVPRFPSFVRVRGKE